MTNFAIKIKTLRNSKNLSQKELADHLNIATRSYQRYEVSEREPTIAVLTGIADYFNVSTDYLLGRTDNPKVNK